MLITFADDLLEQFRVYAHRVSKLLSVRMAVDSLLSLFPEGYCCIVLPRRETIFLALLFANYDELILLYLS